MTIDAPVPVGDQDRLLSVLPTLRAISADLDKALAAHDRHDGAAVLAAVRMIQGRAVITRAALEHKLGLATVATDLPPLVRVVQALDLPLADRRSAGR